MEGSGKTTGSHKKGVGTAVDHYATVLHELQKLKVGQRYRIRDLAKKNPELFIQIVKHLIEAGWNEFYFSNDYKEVIRGKTYAESLNGFI